LLASQRQFNAVDSFSHAVSSHQLKFGVDYRRLMPIIAQNGYFLVATFTSLQQVLNSAAAPASSPRGCSQTDIREFLLLRTDTWKISRRLTLDLGLRWEINPAPGELWQQSLSSNSDQ